MTHATRPRCPRCGDDMFPEYGSNGSVLTCIVCGHHMAALAPSPAPSPDPSPDPLAETPENVEAVRRVLGRWFDCDAAIATLVLVALRARRTP